MAPFLVGFDLFVCPEGHGFENSENQLRYFHQWDYSNPTGNPYKPTRIQWNDRGRINQNTAQVLDFWNEITHNSVLQAMNFGGLKMA